MNRWRQARALSLASSSCLRLVHEGLSLSLIIFGLISRALDFVLRAIGNVIALKYRENAWAACVKAAVDFCKALLS